MDLSLSDWDTEAKPLLRHTAARVLAIFLGGFALLNILGRRCAAGFDANIWWIDFRPVPDVAAVMILLAASVLLIGYALAPHASPRRRTLTCGLVVVLLFVSLYNVVNFYALRAAGSFRPAVPVPFSAVVAACLVLILRAVQTHPTWPRGKKHPIAGAVILAACLIGLPLAQMYFFGKSDYRRRADAVVVFGAAVYPDGRCSDALADRIRTACKLYQEGLADKVILSGGPGQGSVHETEGMRRMATALGVPDEAIILETDGLSTAKTAANTCEVFERLGARRIMAVSHFYHLPRIKMAYRRAGWEVYTVPAKESYLLTYMPYYVAREVAALWVYYLRPLGRGVSGDSV